MVNTFLPYADYDLSAQSLDYRRLGKQRVETYQVLRALIGESDGWRNHPITKMWQGYEYELAEYGIAICKEWIARGYKDTLLPKFEAMQLALTDTGKPFWLGNLVFHRSHQSNLKRKDPLYYDFDVDDNLPYLWADNATQTFRIVEGKTNDKNKSKQVARV